MMKVRDNQFSQYLFLANAIFNAIGAVILFVAPCILIERFGLGEGATFLVYLLAVCSLSLAILSWCAFRNKERTLARAAAVTFLVFHFVSALVSVWYVCMGGGEVYVWVNAAVHLLFAGLFCVSMRQIVAVRKAA